MKLKRSRSALLGVLLALVLGVLLWQLPKGEQSRTFDPGPVPVAAPAPPPSSGAGSASLAVASHPSGLQQVFRENLIPGRMLFLDFILGADGLQLVGAVGAAGRSKSLGLRRDLGLIHYEVFDAAGRLTEAGSVEDPTRRRIEYPASSDDGRIGNVVLNRESGTFAVRLAGESAARRIVFFRAQDPLASGAGRRQLVGEVFLQ